MEKVLVTGAAGFIGYHVSSALLSLGYHVVGLDNLVPYYDIKLKKARLKELGILPASLRKNQYSSSMTHPNFRFKYLDVSDRDKVPELFKNEKFDRVIHLAAQPGVRESIKNPYKYIDSNLNGFITILEACRFHAVKHLLFASSSSVYGNNQKVPFSEEDRVDQPISLYAATKKSGELMAYTYSHLYDIPITALRFFTVYGPWGRPDMAYFMFVKSIVEGKPISVYNEGNLMRDFTYIDDIVKGVTDVMKKIPGKSGTPYRLLNIGHSEPVKLMEFIETIENILDKKALMNFLPMQEGDVYTTYADVEKFEKLLGYNPTTSISDGLTRFVAWYKKYYSVTEPKSAS